MGGTDRDGGRRKYEVDKGSAVTVIRMYYIHRLNSKNTFNKKDRGEVSLTLEVRLQGH